MAAATAASRCASFAAIPAIPPTHLPHTHHTTHLLSTCFPRPSFGNLTAAHHTVSGKDSHNCPGSTSQNIGQPPALVVSSTKTDVSCNGGGDGSVTVTISGGTPGYQCSLDGG